jgi:hypothetical protein
MFSVLFVNCGDNIKVYFSIVTHERNRYGVEKTVDTHKILIHAIKCYDCLFKKYDRQNHV